MLTTTRSVIKSAAILLSVSVLSACALTSGAGIRGASSMTIDVEVYKGPLSKTLQVQKHELEAQAADVVNTLFLIRQKARLLANQNNCQTNNLAQIEFASETARATSSGGAQNGEDGKGGQASRKTLENEIDKLTELSTECFIVVGISYDAWELRRASQTMSNLISLREQGITTAASDISGRRVSATKISEFAKLGARLRTRSDYWATHLATADISDQQVRALVAEFVHYSSEFGNQLVSRSDALLIQEQQNYCTTNDNAKPCPKYQSGLRIAGLLSTGLYLRDSSTTNYINLYDWADAIPGRLPGLSTGPSRRDRVRTVELLINDTYWSNINSVYASGQGDVSMAFIKDDIGNWNLKSFENDPTELLNAYDTVAISSLRQAARLTRNVASGGGTQGIDQLLQIAGGASPAQQTQSGSLNVSSLDTFRAMLIQNIDTREAQYETARDALNSNLAELQGQITTDNYARLLVRAEVQRSLGAIDSQIIGERDRILEESDCNEAAPPPKPAPSGAQLPALEPRENVSLKGSADEERPAVCSQLDDVSAENVCETSDTLTNANLSQLCQRREPLQTRLNALDGSAGSSTNDAGITVTQVCSQPQLDTESSLAINCRRHAEMSSQLSQIRRDTIADVQRYIADHKAVVNALQLSAAAPDG